MSKYYFKMLLSILLLSALIIGCSSSTEGVKTHEKQSENLGKIIANKSSEGEGTNVDSEKAIEGASDDSDDSDDKVVFSSLRMPGNKPNQETVNRQTATTQNNTPPRPGHKPTQTLGNNTPPIPGHKPCVEIRNEHVRFYANPYQSYRLIFENLDTSTPGYFEVQEDTFYGDGWGDVNKIPKIEYGGNDGVIDVTRGIGPEHAGVTYEIWWTSSKTNNIPKNLGVINCS